MMGARPLAKNVMQDLLWPFNLLKNYRPSIDKLSTKSYSRVSVKLNLLTRPRLASNQFDRALGSPTLMLYRCSKSRFVKIIVGSFGGCILIKNFLTSYFCVEAAAMSMENVTEEADVLYDKLQFEELYQLLLPYKDAKNADILWRLARAMFEKAKIEDKTAEKKVLYSEALNLLTTAESLDRNNFAVHKWLAIIMDSYYTLDGIKSRISHLYDMKTHMEKACELKPNDGTSWYVLGMWYFGIANISWYEKKAASIFFATPPEASFDDALKFFMKAEKVEPNFYSKNYLMIGKCLYYLGRKEEAKEYLLKAKDYLQKTEDDKEAAAEAEKWLKSA